MTSHTELIENAKSFTTDSSPNRMLEQIQASAQAISTLTAEVEELRALVGKAHTFLTTAPLESGYCCCGEAIGSHGFGSGHSPVDELQYHASNLAEELRAPSKEKLNAMLYL